MHSVRARCGALIAALMFAVASFTGFAPSAGASVQPGILLVKGVGSTYAASGSTVSLWTTAGGTVTFGFQVRNTSTRTAQFNVRGSVSEETCSPTNGCPAFPDAVITSGSLVVTKVSQGPYGYWTAPIDPGKSITYALKITVPKTQAPTDVEQGLLSLYDIQNQPLGSATFQAGVTATTGKYASDEFITATGAKSVGFWDDFTPSTLPSYVSGASVAITKSATYAVKLINDSTAATSIGFKMIDQSSCGAQFPFTAKVGTTDVTDGVKFGIYHTPTLAPKKFVTVTVTVTYLATGCSAVSDMYQAVSSATGSLTQTLYLVTNPLAS